MPERPRHGEQPPELSKPEAVVGIRLETLRPDVREYAQNLEAQIRELYEKRETLDKAELQRLSALTKQLGEIMEQGDLSAEAYEGRAVRLVEDAKEDVRLIGDVWDDADVMISEEAANTEIASAEAAMDRLDEAEEMIKKVGYAMDTASVYRHLAEAEIRVGRNPTASLEKAIHCSMDVEGNISVLVQRLDRLADVFVSAGDFYGAKTMLHSFRKKLGQQTFNHRLALLEARVGRFDDAKRTASAITEPTMKVDAFCALAIAEAKAGRVPTASFVSAIAAVKKAHGYKAMANEYVDIALAQVEAGQEPLESIKLAKSIVKEVVDSIEKGILFSRIALVEARVGHDPSLSFKRAKDAAILIKSGKFKNRAYREIGCNEVKAARFEDAIEMALGIVNDPECLDAYTAIVQEFLEAERTVEAMELLKANERIHELDRVRLYGEAIDVQARKEENPDGTLALARAITEKFSAHFTQAIAFGTLALASVRADRDPSALFAEADKAVRLESDPDRKNQGLAAIASFKAKAAVVYHQRAKGRLELKHEESFTVET